MTGSLDASEFAGVRLLIRDGREIRYQVCGELDRAWLEQLLMGHAMGAIQYQRGRLPLHGNCLVHEDQTVLLCGHSGAGKSTASLALLSAGGTLLADDLTALQPASDGRRILAWPGIGRLKLWEDSCTWFDVPRQELSPVPGQPGKFYYPRSPAQAEVARPVDRIYCLLPDERVDTPTLEPLDGGDKLRWLQAHLYKAQLQEAQRNWPDTFATLAVIADRCMVALLRRPVGRFERASLLSPLTSDWAHV
jgi:hypothetical protein